MGFFWVLPKRAFWVRDCGNKFLGMQSACSLPDPGKSVDPEHEFYPIPEPFSYEQNGERHSQYPPYFSILCKPWFETFSFGGLLVLPFVFGIATSFLALWIGGRIYPFRHPALLAIVLFFATPLTFYHFVFWEHTLSVFLCLAATAFILCGDGRSSFFFLAGAVLGTGLFFREESFLYFLSLLLACAMDRNKRAKSVWLFFGFFGLACLWLGVQSSFGIGPLQHFFQQTPFSSWSLKRIEVLANLVFGSGDDFWMRGLGILLFLGMVSGIFRKSQVQEAAQEVLQGLGIFGILVYAGWLWWSPEKSVAHLLHFNGMLLVFPLVLILFLRREEEKSSQENFLLRVSLGFCAWVGLTCPWITSLGVHWGPRVLLPAVPVLALLILMRFECFLNEPLPVKRVRVALFAGWLLASVLLQGHALCFLFDKLSLNQKIEEQLRQAPEKVMVTTIPWLAEEMAPLFLERPIFYCRDQESFQRLIERLKQKNIQQFLLLQSATTQEDSGLELPKKVPYFLVKAERCFPKSC